MAPRPAEPSAGSHRRALARSEPDRRPAYLLRRLTDLLCLGEEQFDGIPRRLGYGGRRRRLSHAVRTLPRGAEAGGTLCAPGGPRGRAAFLDRRPAGRGGQPRGVLRAPAAALSAGQSVRVLLLLLAFASCAAAQDYPSRPIRIVVAFPAGGGSHLAARVVGARLADRVGQPAGGASRPDANRSAGAAAVARAAPGGYTLVMGRH